MKPFNRFANRYRRVVRWAPPSAQAAALALLLIGLLTGASVAQPPAPKSSAHVYLLRGAFNVFSLGLDDLGEQVRRMGVPTTVANHLAWSGLADQAAAQYKSGRLRNIILVGHSLGAIAVTEMAARLGQRGVPVKLAIGLDPTARMQVSGHVDRYVNYYIADGMGKAVDRGPQFTGVLENVDVEKNPALNHFNIDKNRALQEQVLRMIRAAL